MIGSPNAKQERRVTSTPLSHRPREPVSFLKNPPRRPRKVSLSSDPGSKGALPAPIPHERSSVLLRRLLVENPGVKYFTVQRLLEYMGHDRPEASLMLLSVPGVIPIPTTSDLVGSPTMMIAGQMMAGRKAVRLPRYLRRRSVPRRALAIAIHTVLPILERAERLTKERWHWACTPAAKRVLGLLVFLIALPLAFPFLGFNIPHAASLFTISVGLIERDGLAIALGVAIGVTSLVLLTGSNLLPTKLVRKSALWIKDLLSTITNVGQALKSAMRCALNWMNKRIFGGDYASQSCQATSARQTGCRLSGSVAGPQRSSCGVSRHAFASSITRVPSLR